MEVPIEQSNSFLLNYSTNYDYIIIAINYKVKYILKKFTTKSKFFLKSKVRESKSIGNRYSFFDVKIEFRLLVIEWKRAENRH